MVDDLVIDHVAAIHLVLILFDSLEDDVNIVFWGLIWRGQFAIMMEVACLFEVILDGGMSDVAAFDGLASDQGDCITCQEIISCLDVLLCEAGTH